MPSNRKSSRSNPPNPEASAGVSGEGFYSGAFSPREMRDLADLEPLGLDDEISMLRVSTRLVFELANGVEDLEQSIDALRALGMAATRLSSLLRSQRDLHQQANQAIQTALHEVLQEMKLI